VSHKPGGGLPLLSARPAVIPQPLRGLLPILLLGKPLVNNVCEQFSKDCYPTASRLRFDPMPFCASVQHANHSATEAPHRSIILNISAFSIRVLMCYCSFTFPLCKCHFIFFIVLFYFVLLFNMHVFIVLLYRHISGLRPLPMMFKKLIDSRFRRGRLLWTQGAMYY